MLWNSARLGFLGLLLLLTSCVAAAVGAGVVVGVWGYDAYTDDGGEITFAHPPSRVFSEALYVAEQRGTLVSAKEGAMRIQCTVDESEVIMQIFVVAGSENSARLKVSARSALRGEPELARSFAEDIRERLP